METEKTREILIKGCAYTPRVEEDYDGPDFRYDHITHDLADKVRGLPCYINHDVKHEDGTPRKPIGEVVDAYVDSKGNLMTFLHIKDDPVAQKLLPDKLIKGPDGKRFLGELSLGTDILIDEREKFNTKVHDRNPKELSIVGKGYRPSAYIEDFWFVSEGENIKEKIIDLI